MPNCCGYTHASKLNLGSSICHVINQYNSQKERFTISVIVILIAASLIVALSFLIAFLWAVKSGQYKDTYTPSVRILFDNNENDSVKNEK
ncbi:MAG: cbb3-type cytochrome oxidase assembly protein CcoS [Ignavibacteriaceae bacterium]